MPKLVYTPGDNYPYYIPDDEEQASSNNPAWVDNTPAVLQNPDASPADVAAYRVNRSVKRDNPLPVADDRAATAGFFGPANPEHPSYIMEPDLTEAQGGMHLPSGLMQEDSGRFYYADKPDETIPVVRRPNVLPVAATPEGIKFVTPKLLDVVGNVMGNVGGPLKVPAKAGEMVLGSGVVKKAEEFPTQAYHGTSMPGFTEFKDIPHDYMLDRALGVHVAKDPAISETFVKDKGAVYPVKIPDDSKFLKVDQPLLPYIEDKKTPKHARNVISDQNAIEKLVMSTVYKKDPEMFARYLTQARHVPEQDALKLAKDMIAGKTVDLVHDGKTDFKGFIENFGGGKPYNEADRTEAIKVFKKEMQDKGYVGIKYINTSPMETANAKDPTSYIVFDPHKHIQSKYTKTLMSDTKGVVAGQVAHQIEKNGFYSALQTAVANAKPNSATAEQWLGYLRNQPGVKSEEINTVLKELPTGQISKQQLNDIVKQNKVELNETNLGVTSFDTAISQAKASGDLEAARLLERAKALETVKQRGTGGISNSTQNFINEARQPGPNFPLPAGDDGKFLSFEAVNRARNYAKAYTDTKYHQWQLPGGENYREMLIQLPEKKIDLNRIDPTWITKKVKDGVYQAIGDYDKNKNVILAYGKTPQEALENAVKETSGDWKDTYKAPHFDENGTNLLAHVRMNDRFIPDNGQTYKNLLKIHGELLNELDKNPKNQILKQKIRDNQSALDQAEKGSKTLHLEEIQSDWHQQGRKHGYIQPDLKWLKRKAELVDKDLIRANAEDVMGNPDLKAGLDEAVKRKIITQQSADDYMRLTKNENSTIPDAPFKKNWDELVLKRIIRHAAENGYEGISWTPGEAQALRYPDALRQKINGIEWEPRPKYMEKYRNDNKENVKHIVVDGKEGKPWFDVDDKGEIVSASMAEAKGKHLSEVIGKDMSQQILEKREGNIDAKDFVMGAEGMKGFYDKMLVDKANNLIKKYGSKAEQKELNYGGNKFGNKYGWEKDGDYYFITTPEGRLINGEGGEPRRFESRQAVQHEMKSLMQNKTSQPIHYFPITPELKKKAMEEGFPLFSSSPTLVPVTHTPEFDNEKKKPILKPVSYIPEF